MIPFAIERIFYKLCRCGLCHEAELDPRVSFVEASGLRSSPEDRGGQQHLELSTGWILQLAVLVIGAPENANLLTDEHKAFWTEAPCKPVDERT